MKRLKFDEIASWWNSTFMKQKVGQNLQSTNISLMKCKWDNTPSWQKSELVQWQVDKMMPHPEMSLWTFRWLLSNLNVQLNEKDERAPLFLKPRKSYWRRRLSTVDLHVLTSSDQLLFILKILFTSFTKQATLMWRSTVVTVLSLPP